MMPSAALPATPQVYQPCILQTKKRYVGFAYETPGQAVPAFDAKGIETVRRWARQRSTAQHAVHACMRACGPVQRGTALTRLALHCRKQRLACASGGWSPMHAGACIAQPCLQA
jgi:hypothetical protein